VCGFSGYFYPYSDGSLPPKLEWLKNSDIKIKHRGPDANGQFVAEHFGVCHCRLAIIDLTSKSNQPLNEEEFTLVFNGEIYNFRELAEKEGWGDCEGSDTKFLMKWLRKYKTSRLKELRGMFAFAFSNQRTNEMILARDQFGQKPLFYGFAPDGVLYFSSVVSNLKDALGEDLSETEARHYEHFQFLMPGNTLYKNIYEVRPGEVLIITEGNLARSFFWIPSSTCTKDPNSSELKYLLRQAVGRAFVADVDLGLTLSGGLDSSLISGIASLELGLNFKCFTGRYIDSPALDESRFAAAQARHISKEIEVIDISAADFDNAFLETMSSLEIPMAGPGSVGQFIVARTISKSFKVSISGQGGDELFAGYARYFINDPNFRSGNFMKSHSGILNDISLLPHSDNIELYLSTLYRGKKPNSEIENRSLETSFFEFKSYLKELIPNHEQLDFITLATLIDQILFLPTLLRVEDTVTMFHGLEGRSPFLDVDLANYVNDIPGGLRISGGPKSILKNLYPDKVHPVVMGRKDKMGFPVPLEKWLAMGSLPIIENFLEPKPASVSSQREIWGEACKNWFNSQISR
jgi:asparagine synthase (glutamine-hydrolysing)